MSESTTNSTASSSDLDNIPLVRLMVQNHPEIQNVELVEYSEVTSGFVSECLNDEESTAGTVTEDDSETEASAAEEHPIDIPRTSEQSQKTGNWPTLQILPGGVIQPPHREEVYPLNIYDDGDDEHTAEEGNELMYACAKCPERFKLLFCLVRHVRWHEDQKKREAGLDLSKLSHFERELIFLKRTRTDVERRYKKKKLDVMTRIATSMGNMEQIIENIE